MNPAQLPPSLPTYASPQGIRVADRKEQGPIMKMIGKMLAAKLPKLGKNPNIHSQTVKINHSKRKKEPQVKYW